MATFRRFINRDPKTMEGAFKWTDAELARIEIDKNKENEEVVAVYNRIRPLRQDGFRRKQQEKKRIASI